MAAAGVAVRDGAGVAVGVGVTVGAAVGVAVAVGADAPSSSLRPPPMWLNVTDTLLGPVITTVQLFLCPLHAPPHVARKR